MKNELYSLLVGSALVAAGNPSAAQGSAPGMNFFRISGAASTTVTALGANGLLVWSNRQPGGTFTIQCAASLAAGSHWINYLQIPAANSLNTNLIPCLSPTAAMGPVPAGAFTMGDTLDGETDAVPVTVTVTGFYLDTNLVSWGQWQSVYQLLLMIWPSTKAIILSLTTGSCLTRVR